MKSHSPSLHGQPLTAAAVVGSFALAVVVLMRVLGVFDRVDLSFREWYVERGFSIEASSVQPWWDFLLVMGVVYALVWLLFETPGTGRRGLILLTVMVLLLTASPVVALWGTFWAPVGVMLGAAWSGFCAILWARQHPMPCELPEVVEPKPEKGKIVPLTREEEKREEGKTKSKRRNGSSRGKR